MIKKKLIRNARTVDKFLIKFLNEQKAALWVNPMQYGGIAGGKTHR